MSQPSRLEAALNLACAAITVLFCGELARAAEERKPRNYTKRKSTVVLVPGEGLKQRAIINYSKIAREAGVTPQHVRLVALGRVTSGRVSDLIARDMRQINGTEAMPEFHQSRIVRGVIAEVARDLNLSHEHVRQVAYGHRKSARVLIALKQKLSGGAE
jgi:hypothetical protein